MKPKKIFVILVALSIVAIATVLSAMVFKGRIFAFVFERFTGSAVSYSKWEGNPFSRSVISSLELIVRKEGAGVRAERMVLSVDTLRLLKDRQIVGECILTNSALFLMGKDPGMSDDILGIVSYPGQIFDNVRFFFTAGKETFSITSFSAASDDIMIKGDFSLNKKTKLLSLNVSISISPILAEKLEENVKTRVLSSEENGWYGTSIVYNGNPEFIRALYFAVSPAG
ncbi:MAG: hypothetical protein WCV56_03160 [Candidatus Omnitrophota bacterium]